MDVASHKSSDLLFAHRIFYYQHQIPRLDFGDNVAVRMDPSPTSFFLLSY